MLTSDGFVLPETQTTFRLTARDAADADCELADFFDCAVMRLANHGCQSRFGIAGFESSFRLIASAG